MPDIARLDENGLLVAVETVADDEHGTDLAKRKIALPDGHDMRRHLKNYRWDVLRGHFIPKSMEPLAEAERETPELVEGLVEAIEHIYETIGGKQRQARAMAVGGDDDAPVELPPIAKRAIRKVPSRRAASQAGHHHAGQRASRGAGRGGRGQPRQ